MEKNLAPGTVHHKDQKFAIKIVKSANNMLIKRYKMFNFFLKVTLRNFAIFTEEPNHRFKYTTFLLDTKQT